jgi:hypothetical protein
MRRHVELMFLLILRRLGALNVPLKLPSTRLR